MRRSYLIIAAATLFAVTGCKDAGVQKSRPVAPAATVVGDPVSCIPISQIRETQVRDDQTIDFIANNNKVWRNTLPNRCPTLGSERAFGYSTSLTQICSTDIIFVVRNNTGGLERGPSCGLGAFVPVQLEKPEKKSEG